MKIISKIFFSTSMALVVGCFLVNCPLVEAIPAQNGESRLVELQYKTTIPADQVASHNDFSVWIPMAKSRAGQTIVKRSVEVSNDISYSITDESKYGNKMIYIKFDEALSEDVIINVTYQVEINPSIHAEDVLSNPADTKYLTPSRLMIVDDVVKDIARDLTDGLDNTEAKARAIFDYVFKTVQYDKNEPGWGQGDTQRVCLVGKGNCTDFHSLFISLARAANIPSRFMIGFQIPEGSGGQIKGYHCWAQFYANGQWKTVDISEAWKNPAKKDFFFGGFDVNKFTLTSGRDINLDPQQATDALNIFFYPYAEAAQDNVTIETSFSFKDLSV